ncbi:glycosyltransferase family 4 protein [Gayadomonas joobiniege]|uniref:glycosyltransferase family 4 protein n=1 Tax=Gayadomonas joobiniege TaxID=1234606 RepID=UPI00035D7240|nr:glycosyltransferase family 4 protein [Gayadomonas joobiniege]
MTVPLHIVHIIFSRGFAGSERSTAESCNQQIKNHQVTLIIRKGHRKNQRSIVDRLDKRVKLIEVHHQWFTGRRLKQLFSQLKPDVIHCHLRRATRLVANLQPNAATLSTLHISANGRGFKKMDGLVCNARWQVNEITPWFKGLIHKANNSLTPHAQISAQKRQTLRSGLGVDDQDILLAAVGRYHNSKGWDTLINALQIRPEYHQLKVRFFGNGGDERQLRELAQNDPRIQFVGFRDDIKDLYQCFDLLVCPSRFEPLPRVILEAMDAGTPVIASDIGGCKELIDDYGGALFKVNDEADLANRIDEFLLNQPERHQPDLSAHYVENANLAMLDFYQQLIHAKGL